MILVSATKWLNLIGYKGLTMAPFVFYKGEITKEFRNHERIHIRQQLEMLWLPFFIAYFSFYFIGRLKGLKKHDAYRAIPFEREAYDNENNLSYLDTRKFWA